MQLIFFDALLIFNMPHFFVSIDEGQKNIINQKIVKVDSNTTTFNKIYEAITKDLFYR